MANVTSISAAYTTRVQAETQYAVAARLLRIATQGGAQPETLAAVQAAAGEAMEAFSAAVENLARGLDVYA